MHLRNILFFALLAPLVALDAWGQTKLPAKQITVNSESWLTISPTVDTAQATFDSVDAFLSGSNLLAAIPINASNISVIASNISVNASNISVNASNISVNASNISVNASNISVNASNISVNESNISVNASNISVNASNILTAASNILTRLPGTNIVGYSFTDNQWFPGDADTLSPADFIKTNKITSGSAGDHFASDYETVSGLSFLTNAFTVTNGVFTAPVGGNYNINVRIKSVMTGSFDKVEALINNVVVGTSSVHPDSPTPIDYFTGGSRIHYMTNNETVRVGARTSFDLNTNSYVDQIWMRISYLGYASSVSLPPP